MAPRGHVEALLQWWDAVQVELQGRYSLPRLREVVAHAKHSNRFVNWLIVLVTPFPPLALLVLTDALPQNPPHLGLWHQTAWVVFRLFFLCWFAAFVFAQQVRESSPSLPLSTVRLWVVSVAVGVVAVLPFCVIGSFWFPVPLGVEVALLPWLVTFGGCLWYFWHAQLQTDTVACANLKCYTRMLICQTSIITTYVAYSIAFQSAGAQYQTYVSFLLPVLKLAFKNFAHRGLLHMEDLAPSMIVFNIDVFHAVFVSTTMQESVTRSTIVVIMVVDVIQALVAYFEVKRIVARVAALAEKCQQTAKRERYAPSSPAHDDRTHSVASTLNDRVRSLFKLKFGVVAYALHIVETTPRIRDHPEVVLPRHLRARVATGPDFTALAAAHAGASVRDAAAPCAKISPTEALIGPAKTPTTTPETPHPVALTDVERMQLKCVTSVLKMLHMIEFYVLIEYAEVVVSVIYTLYVRAISNMPNRVYFPEFRDRTDQDFDATVAYLATYAALELVSFVAFCLVVNRELQHMSTIQQLAFVLQRHWRLSQVALAWWVWVVLNLSFEHFGMDYTFRFEWLSSSHSKATSPLTN